MAETLIITGASGIAAATARRIALSAKDPSQVQIGFCGLSPNDCQILADELISLNAKVDFLVGDLTDPEFAPRFVEKCQNRFGTIQSLFNVAGISGRQYGDGRLHECTESGWTRTIDGNLTLLYRVSREVISRMIRQPLGSNGQRGVVLNMASILGVAPEPTHFDTIAYATSKGAIVSMTRSMAASYLPDRIRVNAIAPALVKTAMSARASQNEAVVEFVKKKQPLTDGMMPIESVAAACHFLLSDASLAITGQTLMVDGGWSLS